VREIRVSGGEQGGRVAWLGLGPTRDDELAAKQAGQEPRGNCGDAAEGEFEPGRLALKEKAAVGAQEDQQGELRGGEPKTDGQGQAGHAGEADEGDRGEAEEEAGDKYQEREGRIVGLAAEGWEGDGEDQDGVELAAIIGRRCRG
jgi:hypothetical protein